ncbi:baseplate J/gp47 family protein [Microbulbifer thermotolerans]|uniref:baseplate J/gp47 family protein n=1 Tax=Microbulbifer thermotolerans TaxID=252514 RepID=UPI00224A88A9|nr:baseplate J/gp47 family protein [Microbulbifer thermotolerans]MCX2834452.1 baseplate J/gp47 family protein [Microbulbifer thermotolerans]
MSEQQLFTNLVREGGLPTTESEVRAEFEAEVVKEDVAFTNDSAVSPWWRMVTALITKPVIWLIETLINAVMPQMFVKTASGLFLDLLAWGVNLERKRAVAAQGRVQFTRATTAGTLEVPADTAVQSANINGRVYTLRTTETVTFEDGRDTVLAPVIAEETGSAYNLAAGYYSVLPVLLPGITAVTNLDDWLLVPGADEETDDDLRARIRTQFMAVNQWHTDAVYRALISSFDGVAADNVYFDSDAPRGPGTADAYVMLEIGTPDPAFIASIQSKITDEGNHGHGDDLQVFAMPETLHDVTATIYPMENLSSETVAQLQADVENFIRAAFRENQDYSPTLVRPWSRFSFSFLAGELHAQFPLLHGVDFNIDYIVSEMALPRLNSLTVTVA